MHSTWNAERKYNYAHQQTMPIKHTITEGICWWIDSANPPGKKKLSGTFTQNTRYCNRAAIGKSEHASTIND